MTRTTNAQSLHQTNAGIKLNGGEALKNYSENASPHESGSWEKIAARKDLRVGRPIIRVVGGEEIAVFQIGEELHAITNVCPHQHAPVLAEGRLEGTHIECPMHGWKYDISTGKGIESSGRLDTYQTKIVGDDIFVFLCDEEEEDYQW